MERFKSTHNPCTIISAEKLDQNSNGVVSAFEQRLRPLRIEEDGKTSSLGEHNVYVRN